MPRWYRRWRCAWHGVRGSRSNSGWRRCGSRGNRSRSRWLERDLCRRRLSRRRSRPHSRGFCRGFLRFLFHFGRRFGSRFRISNSLEVLAHFLGDIHRDGTRVRLLLRDAIPWQEVDDGFGLDLEFAGQLVDSDLVCVSHASLGFGLFWMLLIAFRRCRRIPFGVVRHRFFFGRWSRFGGFRRALCTFTGGFH
jgi:hypothetical protein